MEYLAAKLEKDSKRRQNNGEDNINTSSCSHFTLQFLFFFKQDYGIADWVGRHWYEGCYIYMYMFFIYIYIYISALILPVKKIIFPFSFFVADLETTSFWTLTWWVGGPVVVAESVDIHMGDDPTIIFYANVFIIFELF